ncbi:hypothetical protein MKW92_015700, partial [Papaver armeniacum]
YDSSKNSWVKESSIPRNPIDSSFGFAALYGKMHVMSSLNSLKPSEKRRQRHRKKCRFSSE